MKTAICTCNHYAPRREDLVSPAFNKDLAQYWKAQCPSIQQIHDAVLKEVLNRHSGTLYDLHREPINLLAHDGSDDWLDRAFGKDAWRTLRRYLVFAETTRVNRLRKEHINLALVLHHARSIRNCRLVGLCSQRELHKSE